MQRTRGLAINSAVEKAKSEIGATSGAGSEEMTKKHAQEIQALRAEHEVALKKAAEAAVATAAPDDATKAAIGTAIAEHDKKVQAKHAEEIAAAVERGRMEQVAKGKLKDAQLVRSQTKLKELEAQVLEWRKAGLIPEAIAITGAAPGPATAAPTVTTAVPASSVTAPHPTTPTTPVASTSKAPAPAAPARAPAARAPAAPAVPSAASTSAPAPTSAASAPPIKNAPLARGALGGAVPLGTTDAGRGRGAPRGRGRGFSIRGAAPGHPHGQPGGAGPSAPANTVSTPVGVQIMGAANKRGREDETQPDDSLVKRLKPAVGEGGVGAGAPNAAGNKPPVAIRRPPPS